MPIVGSWQPLPASFRWLVLAGLIDLTLISACSKGGDKPDPGPDAAVLADSGLADAGGSPDGAGPRDAAVPADATVPADAASRADLASAPDLATLSNDPFDPASCPGTLLNLASKIPAGGTAAVLVPYTMRYQQRPCTDFTGCGSWVSATPSWGPSGSGNIWLKVTGTGIIAAVVDGNAGSAYGTPIYNLGMDCTLAAGVWNCGDYVDTEIVEGANFLRFGGRDKFSGSRLPIQGELHTNCARLFGSVVGPKTAGAYTEYRGGAVLRY